MCNAKYYSSIPGTSCTSCEILLRVAILMKAHQKNKIAIYGCPFVLCHQVNYKLVQNLNILILNLTRKFLCIYDINFFLGDCVVNVKSWVLVALLPAVVILYYLLSTFMPLFVLGQQFPFDSNHVVNKHVISSNDNSIIDAVHCPLVTAPQLLLHKDTAFSLGRSFDPLWTVPSITTVKSTMVETEWLVRGSKGE